jgi:hypothetical protein
MVFNLKKILFFTLLLAVGATASAQAPQLTNPTADVDDSAFIDVRVTPENPSALSPVTLFLASNLINLSTATIVWSIDGKQVLSGVGARELATVTGAYGKTITITATITSPSGTVVKTINLTPQDITLLWEATDSYVPPFYQGKKLPGRESLVRLTAIPNFSGQSTFSDKKNNVFVWKRNGTTVSNASGYGNSSFLIKQNPVRSQESVGVSVQSAGSESAAEKTAVLSFFDPMIIFYEEQPSGLRRPLAGSLAQLATDALTIKAEPYFFSTINNNVNKLTSAWTMNRQAIALADTSNKMSVTVKNPGTSGIATLGLAIENPLTPFQSASTSLSLLFRKQ